MMLRKHLNLKSFMKAKRAVGGDTSEFERLLRKEMSKKFNEIIKFFNVHCENIMEKQYEEMISLIRRNIATRYSR